MHVFVEWEEALVVKTRKMIITKECTESISNLILLACIVLIMTFQKICTNVLGC